MSGTAARGDARAVTRRVVHVLDMGAPPGRPTQSAGAIPALACAEACAATPECDHVVLLLGAEADAQAARELGLSPSALVSPPLRTPVLAWRSLRGVVGALGERVLIQPWSDRAARACAASGLAHAAIPTGLLPSAPAPTAHARRDLRARLGLGEHVPAIALLADPPWHADARRFVYMVGLLDVAGQEVAGVVGRATAHTPRAKRFHTEAAVGWQMVLAERPIGAVLHACDLAVIVPPAPHRELSECDRAWVRWSIARSHVLGVPVIGGPEWLDEELCPAEVRPALTAASASITDLGRRLARLVGDAAERDRISRAVRTRALAVASRGRFAEALRAHWGLPRSARADRLCAEGAA